MSRRVGFRHGRRSPHPAKHWFQDAGPLVKPAFSLPVRVYYEDTDAAGVVYYANYLRYLERARTEWLESIGHSLTELERVHAIVFVVRRIEVGYRLPARLGDALDVTVAIRALGRASLTVAQDVRRGHQTLVEALVMLACVDRERFKPARIPISLPPPDRPESKR